MSSHYYQTSPLRQNKQPLMQEAVGQSRAKSLFAGWKDPQQRKRQIYEHSVREHRKLYQKVSFLDPPDAEVRRYKYTPEKLMPFLYFYKLLAKKESDDIVDHHRLRLNLPDTIVYNDSDLPMMWLYTDCSNGLVYRQDNIGSRQVVAKLCDRADQDEVVCVLKKTSYGSEGLEGNEVRFISARELKENILGIGSTRGEINVLQRFVKCNSNKPYVVRTVWRKDRNPECWIITSNTQFTNRDPKVPVQFKYATVPKTRKACTIYRSTNSGFLKETIGYIENIRRYLLRELQIHFDEFIGDFIKDEGGNWWYVNTRGFVLSNPTEKIDIKAITMFGQYQPPTTGEPTKKTVDQYQKCKNCRYCDKVFPEHLMTHRLTLIMLLQADKHLLARGKTFPWLQRCFIQHIGNVNLYIEHKICDSCYTLYKEIEKLMRLEVEFARMLGIAVPEDNTNVVSITGLPAFKGKPPQFGSRFEKNTYNQKMPTNWRQPLGTNIEIKNDFVGGQTTTKYRLMLLIHSIRDVPREALNHTYSLQYSLFESRVRYNLDLSQSKILENSMLEVPVNKIRVFFFFANDRKSLNAFLKDEKTLKLTLLQDGLKIGELEMELTDFLSDKVIKREFYKMFSGKDIMPLLSWGVNATAGVQDSGPIDISNLKLHDYKGIYLHDNKQYYSCDPLPEEWINVIAEKEKLIKPLKTEGNDPEHLMISQHSFGQELPRESEPRLAESTLRDEPTYPTDINHEIMRYSRRKTHSSRAKKRIYF